MNTNEFKLEFNLLYDNIGSSAAPGLDDYEISVYLTTAQEELVKTTYTGNDKIGKAFEGNERRRRELNELVKTNLSSTIVAGDSIVSNSVFFKIPDNVFYIINEQVKLSSSDICLNDKYIMVKPTTHDEFLVSMKNPFRKPNKNKAIRLDLSSIGVDKVVEIVSAYTPVEYKLRYVKKPNPIVITDIETNPDTAGLGLTIDGINIITECELNPEIHREIVNRAVENAIRDYRENNLQSKIQTNSRVV